MKSNTTSFISDFCFNGNRGYVQAPAQLEFALCSLRQANIVSGDVFVGHFKLYREVRENVILVTNREAFEQALSELKFYDNESWQTWYLIPGHRKVAKRKIKEPNVEIEQCDGEFSGIGHVYDICSFRDVFSGIVEINKQLHLRSLGFPKRDPMIRDVSASNFNVLDEIPRTSLMVEITMIGKKSFRRIEYSRSKALWDLDGARHTMELCFSFEKGRE